MPDYVDVSDSQRSAPVRPDASQPDWAAVWRYVEQHDFSGPKLLHGDYHLGNALFEAGKLTGVID